MGGSQKLQLLVLAKDRVTKTLTIGPGSALPCRTDDERVDIDHGQITQPLQDVSPVARAATGSAFST
jgi:hypothetical protein